MVDCRHAQFIAPTLAALTTRVEQGVTSGEFRKGAAAGTPAVLVSTMFHVAVWRLMFADRKPIDGKALIEAHIDLVTNGLLQRSQRAI